MRNNHGLLDIMQLFLWISGEAMGSLTGWVELDSGCSRGGNFSDSPLCKAAILDAETELNKPIKL